MDEAALAIGHRRTATVVRDLTRGQIVQYAGASGDFNPIHTDEIYATRIAGYPSVIAHGMLTMGMTGRVLTDLFGVRSLQRFAGRFRAPVRPGDTLEAEIAVVALSEDRTTVEVEVTTSNQDGVVVFAGSATVLV